MKGKYKRGAITLLKNPASFPCRKEKRRAVAYWIRAWHAFSNFIAGPAWSSGLLGRESGAAGNQRHLLRGLLQERRHNLLQGTKAFCTYSLPGSNQDMKGKCQDTRQEASSHKLSSQMRQTLEGRIKTGNKLEHPGQVSSELFGTVTGSPPPFSLHHATLMLCANVTEPQRASSLGLI